MAKQVYYLYESYKGVKTKGDPKSWKHSYAKDWNLRPKRIGGRTYYPTLMLGTDKKYATNYAKMLRHINTVKRPGTRITKPGYRSRVIVRTIPKRK